MLAWYSGRFDTVEVNNTFYHLPTESAVETWRETVPPGFRFAAKGSRFITHMKKLKDPAPALANYFGRVNLLGRKLGPIVFQLPPHWPANPERLSAFLDALPGGHRYAFEFRDPSWHRDDVYELLHRHGATFCIFELAGTISPYAITAGFAYVRLHGPAGKYEGLYSRDALAGWARRILSWPVEYAWIFFDNDDRGFAARNAGELRELIASELQ